MFEFVLYAVFVALVAAFLILLSIKTGYRERLQVTGGKWISEMANCDFCFSFWVALAVALVVAVVTGDYKLVMTGVLSAPLTRMLI